MFLKKSGKRHSQVDPDASANRRTPSRISRLSRRSVSRLSASSKKSRLAASSRGSCHSLRPNYNDPRFSIPRQNDEEILNLKNLLHLEREKNMELRQEVTSKRPPKKDIYEKKYKSLRQDFLVLMS